VDEVFGGHDRRGQVPGTNEPWTKRWHGDGSCQTTGCGHVNLHLGAS